MTAFAVKTNDQLLLVYLASLIRSVLALHNLIGNKVSNSEAERKDGEKATGGDKAVGGKKEGEGKDAEKKAGKKEGDKQTDEKSKTKDKKDSSGKTTK